MVTTNDRDALVGGLVIFVLGVLLLVVYGPKGINSSTGSGISTYPVTAVFNRVDGLFEGDEVRLGGIRIGTVGAQRLDGNFRAVVTLDINQGVLVPVDSAAAVHTDGLFGSKFVVLEPGVEDQNLVANGTIEYTQGAMIVGELLDLIIDEGRACQAKLATTPKQQGN